MRDYLAACGYTVRGEVRHCDICAVCDGRIVVVELKLRLNLALILQATRRQRITDSVYVAVPRQELEKASRRRQRDLRHLLRRLELGLLLVTLDSPAPRVEAAFHPLPFQRRKAKSAQRAMLREVEARSQDLTPGGSTRTQVITGYREAALKIACCLARFGELSPKALRRYGCCEKTGKILYNNVYGWFDRVGHGLYALHPQGRQAIVDFARVTDPIKAQLEQQDASES